MTSSEQDATIAGSRESTPEGDVMDVQFIASVAVITTEFEVADADAVQVAADELERGFALLHEARTEPWGQTVARLQSSEGAIIGVLTGIIRDRRSN